jgi:hypothetical protein
MPRSGTVDAPPHLNHLFYFYNRRIVASCSLFPNRQPARQPA